MVVLILKQGHYYVWLIIKTWT